MPNIAKRQPLKPSYALLIGSLLFFAMVCVIPFWYVLVSSLSDPQLVKEGTFKLLPTGFSLDAYKIVLRDARFFKGFEITALRTVIGTALALAVQTMMAYALSRHMPGRGIIKRLVVITILFSGGIIPTYLVIQGLNLLDSFWALVLPMVFNPWNVVLLISFFESIPDAIEESAKLDGAGDFKIFLRLAVPLSIPAIATILLAFAAVPFGSVQFFAQLAVIGAVLALTLALMLVTGPVMRVVGVTGSAVLGRLLGVLLAALAAQFVIDGVRGAMG